MPGELYYILVTLVIGALVAASCALLGTFLVLRRMALIGDAISHAILPGIAVGFALSHSRNPFIMLAGAAAAGLVTVWLVESLYRSRRVHEDTSIAVVFPALFALGVILLYQFPHVDLDPDCVYLGEIVLAPDDPLILGGERYGPKALWVLGFATLLNLGLVLLFYKELKLCTFDPALAKALGFSPVRMHYILMTAVSITTVAAFESVGAILVVAFLIVPPAAAYLLTDRLSLMLVLAVAVGVLASTTGYAVSREEVLDASVTGSMATMAGVWFLIIWLAAPQHGLLATLVRRWRQRRRFAADLLLVQLHKAGLHGAAPPIASARLLRDLAARGHVSLDTGHPTLTDAGRQTAVELEREYGRGA